MHTNKASPFPTGERISVAAASTGRPRPSPVANPSKADPAPADCSTCSKTAKQLKDLNRHGDWECSHIECQSRRKCWSSGVKTSQAAEAPKTDLVTPLFDKVEN